MCAFCHQKFKREFVSDRSEKWDLVPIQGLPPFLSRPL